MSQIWEGSFDNGYYEPLNFFLSKEKEKEKEKKDKYEKEKIIGNLLKDKFRMIENLEIKTYSNGTGNLNFRNHINGNDVIADIDEEGNLFLLKYDDNFKESKIPITFLEYIILVQKSVQSSSK